MIEHLIETGLKRIAHIMGPSTIWNSAERATGYKRILMMHGIFDPDLMIKTEGTTFEHGRIAAGLILEKIKDSAAPDRTIVMDAELIYRGSTREINDPLQ